MRQLRHPLSGALYEIDPGTGLVKVTAHERVGWFDARGRWQRGELRSADIHLCQWVGGPQPGTEGGSS